MNKRFILLLLPVLLTTNVVDSTDQPFQLSSTERYELSQTAYSSDFSYLPDSLVAFDDTVSYRDENLQQVAHPILPHRKLNLVGHFVNSTQQMVFQLADGTYIPASSHLFFQDSILSQSEGERTYWLKKGFTLKSSPLVHQAQTLSSKTLAAYQPVLVKKEVRTPVGVFAEIPGQGWVAVADLSQEDNRMEKVQNLLDTSYKKDSLAVYVKQLSSGKTAGIQTQKTFYAASIAKLPLLYYVQDQLDKGELDTTQLFRYTARSMTFPGAYQVGGSGSLPKTPTNHPHSVGELIDKVAKESDNVASNMLGYYVAHEFGSSFYETMEERGLSWDMVSRETTVEAAGRMMEALYEQDGLVLQSLRSTQFDDQRIPKMLPVPVAHKIGDADDLKHDVAVVYAKDPFVLAVFTDQSRYEDISQLAQAIYEILQ